MNNTKKVELQSTDLFQELNDADLAVVTGGAGVTTDDDADLVIDGVKIKIKFRSGVSSDPATQSLLNDLVSGFL